MAKTKNKIPVHCSYDAMAAAGTLKPHPQNPNTHPAEQIELLAQIITAHGWRAPITVSNQSGYVVRGHGRLAAAKKIGCVDVPVDYQDYENESAELADMVADNKLAELAETDGDTLAAVLKKLDAADYPLSLTAIPAEQLDDLLNTSAQVDDLIYQEYTIRPYNQTHILISFDPNLFDQIENHLEAIRKIEGVEIEQGSN